MIDSLIVRTFCFMSQVVISISNLTKDSNINETKDLLSELEEYGLNFINKKCILL